jgi:hypothetical protein
MAEEFTDAEVCPLMSINGSVDKGDTITDQINAAIARDEDRFDEMWLDDSNWKMQVFYNCADDPRTLVYKRVGGHGWTNNFSRNSTRANQLKDQHAQRLSRKKIVEAELKKLGHDPSKVHVPSTLEECYERLCAVSASLDQLNLYLATMANDPKYQKTLGYSNPKDFRTFVQKSDGKRMFNWGGGKTYVADRLERQQKRLTAERDELQRVLSNAKN